MSLGRILLAVAVAACLLGVGVLEVLSERAPREQVLPKVGEMTSDDTEPWWKSGEALSGQALEAGLGSGEVTITNLERDHSVVSDDRPAVSLASLEPGDMVRIERAGGHAQRVVVVRHAWQQPEGEIER